MQAECDMAPQVDDTSSSSRESITSVVMRQSAFGMGPVVALPAGPGGHPASPAREATASPDHFQTPNGGGRQESTSPSPGKSNWVAGLERGAPAVLCRSQYGLGSEKDSPTDSASADACLITFRRHALPPGSNMGAGAHPALSLEHIAAEVMLCY